MRFNHFRIFLALLSALGPFFAYVCRLNLSLIIDDMVEATTQGNETTFCDHDRGGYDYYQDLGHTEEHALAWISRELRCQSRTDHRLIQERDARRAIKPRVSSPATGFPLNIDFDFSERTTPGTTESDTQTITTPSSTVVKERIGGDKLKWTQEEKDSMLGYFFFGYVIFQIPAARSAEIFGAKPLFIVSGLGNAIASLAFPWACKKSFYYAAIMRIFMGAAQATIFPAAYVLLSEWLPKKERSQWLPIPSAFSRFGTIAMNLIIPIVIDKGGWEMVFYVCGMAVLMWTKIFMIFGSSSPESSYWISKSELIYIESCMEPRVGSTSQPASVTASGFSINESALSKPALSWGKFFTNRAIWILTLVMFTSEWSNMLLLIKLPGFLKTALNMSTRDVAFWGTVLVGVYCFQFPFSGSLAARLEAAKIKGLSSLRIRKTFEMTAHTLQAIGALIIAFNSDTTVIVIALIIMMLGRSTVGGGQCQMPPELSREYSGTVFAFANSWANIAGFLGPRLLPYIVRDQTSHASWRPLWICSGVLFFVVGLLFCLFAENQQQNYCRKPKARTPSTTISQAQLTTGESEEPGIIKMDIFPHVMREPTRQSRAPVGSRRF